MDLQSIAPEICASLQKIIEDITVDITPTLVPIVDENLQSITIIISAPENQLGQIIGKEGKIIKSLRTLANIAYPNVRLNLQIKD